ncbi:MULTISPECIES: GRAM domain-containing protein [Polaribacter]|uniref:GRAM domain-containing protein n=1 Tax=Polaribacter marinaquae TaxID=1642819 RepID=A0ABZ2TMW8_9FLAO
MENNISHKKQYSKKEFKLDLTWKQKVFGIFLTSLAYGTSIYFLNDSLSITSAIIQGLLFGILFVLLFPWVMNKMFGNKINNIIPDLLDNENSEDEIFANLFRGFEGVGGKIFLTNQRLIFKSHSLNIQKGQTNIDYNDIVSVTKRKTFKLRDNGIKITTKKGDEYCFVVNNRNVELKNILDKLNV